MTKIVYDFVEVDASDKSELRKQESLGFEIYGVSRDLRQDHPSFVKLRRPCGKEGKK
jgi:hypothetical protein